ncbi:MAG: hypothetical protein ACI9LO_001320, partial [Planctomycetota bacterium]
LHFHRLRSLWKCWHIHVPKTHLSPEPFILNGQGTGKLY